MFRIFKISAKVEDLEKAFRQLEQEFKFYKEELAKMDIKVLESRRVYGRKLKNLVAKEETEELEQKNNESENINSPKYY